MRTAHAYGGGRPVIVSPVTFKQRFNAVATGEQPELVPGELPPQVDPRQMSLFGAGWTLGSLHRLARERRRRGDLLRDDRLARRHPGR